MTLVSQTIAHQTYMGRMNYFNSLRDVKGFVSVWAMDEIDDLDQLVPFKNTTGRRVCYQYIPDNTPWEQLTDPNHNSFVEISTHCRGDTWMDLWEAQSRKRDKYP